MSPEPSCMAAVPLSTEPHSRVLQHGTETGPSHHLLVALWHPAHAWHRKHKSRLNCPLSVPSYPRTDSF